MLNKEFMPVSQRLAIGYGIEKEFSEHDVNALMVCWDLHVSDWSYEQGVA